MDDGDIIPEVRLQLNLLNKPELERERKELIQQIHAITMVDTAFRRFMDKCTTYILPDVKNAED